MSKQQRNPLKTNLNLYCNAIIIMPVKTKTGQWGSTEFVETRPKKTRQGTGKHTKYAASSRNEKKKKYRGQGR